MYIYKHLIVVRTVIWADLVGGDAIILGITIIFVVAYSYTSDFHNKLRNAVDKPLTRPGSEHTIAQCRR